MNNIKQIIATLSKEQQQDFIAYLKKQNKRKDTKNIALFKLLLNENLSTTDVCMTLYGTKKSQAYHALRKRLFKSIIHFSANSSLQNESSIQMDVIKYLLAARSYLQNKHYKTAYKILNKAEAIAQEHQLFALLNEIYNTQVQFAHNLPNLDLNVLIETYNSNKAKHLLEDELNIVYAKMQYELANNTSLNFQTLFTKTLKTFHTDIINQLSFKALYQISSIASTSAFATKDYLNIESFLISTYQDIISKTKAEQPYYHIEVLYLIAYTLFRNKKFDTSKLYLEEMHRLMLKYNTKYFNVFKLKYGLLFALNLNYSNQQEAAILHVKQLVKITHIDVISKLNLRLSLAMFLFQNNNLKAALQVCAKLYHSDKWYIEKMGIEWVIKKHLIEILLHIELGNVDVVASRLLSFKRNYYNYLKSIKEQRAITFLELVKVYFDTPETVTSPAFIAKVETSFNYKTSEQEDIYVMSFYAWLKSKMYKTPLYRTTLEMINRK